MALSLRGYVDSLERDQPAEVVRVHEPVDPAAFEVTALLANLEAEDRYPLVVFERPRDLHGEPAPFPVVTNVFAARQRCAAALGLPPEQWRLPLSLEYARREAGDIPPATVRPSEAPVKEVVLRGADADLRRLPVVRHHHLDPAPYIDMTPVMRDPDGAFYNVAFLRTMFKGPRRLGLHMSPRHNWQIVRRNEQEGRPTPLALVVGHHPAFYLGALNVAPGGRGPDGQLGAQVGHPPRRGPPPPRFSGGALPAAPAGRHDYGLIGSLMGQPLRLVPSETWGDAFLVPADAEIVIEGEVLPGVREVEGPFGEFPGTYGPQRVRWVVEVRAITHRRDALYQDVFVGHADTWVLGALPKEGSLYNRIRGVVPGVRGVHLPNSGCGRFHCYISLDKRVNGESKQAALIALGDCDFVKHVVVVDADIDPFDEAEVLWAVATRVQADRDVDVIRDVKGNTLDPSQTDDILTAKMIIDATRPLGRPFAPRLEVPTEARERMRLDRWGLA